ncbi:hypothetical protein [Salinicola rhizosphaerae]|uniref:hypothetical protein n=1 Tax=Salinicola rhizosphaerae TaxID=1443141 RepID=UPI001678AB75|nr:hypothetical protein [Salinicola rhizosphaerae]
MSSAQSQPGHRGAIWRPRQRAHWWLASVLVGCLLPAGLVHAEALRLAERFTQVYLMAPEAIRAESRRAARVAATTPRRRLFIGWARIVFRLPPAPAWLPNIALDAISRRGPPVPA